MELCEVKSSNIRRVGYDGDLLVEYISGNQYRYKEVPQELYEKLCEAESVGRFMNAEIKGKYEYEKVSLQD